MQISYGVIKDISKDNYNLKHLCETELGSSGSPLLNLHNNKVIGVHKGSQKKKNYNLATFIRKPIEEFKKIIKDLDIKNIDNRIDDIDEINIKYKNTKERNIRLFGDIFVENNKNICKIIVNGVEHELCSHFNLENFNDEFEIKLKGIKNVKNMSYMFNECNNLISLPNIHKWNTFNVTDMSWMFSNCSSLSYISDISKWNICNVEDLSFMFYNCSSLKNLPDISKWNAINVKNINGMLYGCKSLLSLPNISKMKINDNLDVNNIFSEKLINKYHKQSMFIETNDNMEILGEKNYSNEIQYLDELNIDGYSKPDNEIQKIDDILVKGNK